VCYRRWRLAGLVLLLLIGTGLACHAWAHVHYRAAQSALARRDPADAQLHLARCLQVWFLSADTYLLAARTARRAGNFDDVEGYLRNCRALGGSPEAIDVEYQLLSVQQGDLARVERSLVSLLNQGHPDTPLIAEVLTPAFLQTFQLDNAAECVRRWLEREPERIEAWLYRAKVYEYRHNSAEIVTSYRRLVELDPENDQARLLLAGQLIHQHRPQEALEQFQYVRPRLGDTPRVLGGIACCQRELNHPEEARQLLDRVLAEEPHNSLALGERGRLAFQFESAAEAEKWLRRALVEQPAERDLLYSLAQCLQQLGKRQEAERVQAQLQKIEADLARLSELTRKIASRPHDADLRCEAGQIMLRNGQETEGLRWLASALQEDPSHAATLQALADYQAHAADRQGSPQKDSRTRPHDARVGEADGRRAR
jgi:Tfp pilus assembly protein PilF